MALEDSVVTLWERLGESLGATFLNQYGAVGEEAFHTWVRGLADLKPEQIETGFINFLRSPEKYLDLKSFRALCLNLEQYGLPDAHRAYMEAAMHCHEHRFYNWSHIAVYKTLLDVGIAVMREFTEERAKPLFAARYKIICDMVIRGEDLNVELPKAIPSKVPNFLTPEENHARMVKMREELGL